MNIDLLKPRALLLHLETPHGKMFYCVTYCYIPIMDFKYNRQNLTKDKLPVQCCSYGWSNQITKIPESMIITFAILVPLPVSCLTF